MGVLNFMTVFGLLVCSVQSLEIEEACRAPSSRSTKTIRGKCLPLGSCPELIAAIRRGIYPFVCGFRGKETIVCCPTKTKNQGKLQPSNRISKQKCMEYGKNVFKKKPVLTMAGQSYVNESTCEYDFDNSIFENIYAKQGEFPHMALIGTDDDKKQSAWLCSGSLISEKFVLTVAHCVISPTNGEVKWVRLGDLDFESPNDNSNFLNLSIVKIHRHPNYHRPSFYNDIALLELNHSVSFSENIRPACIYSGSDAKLDKFIISGWALAQTVKETENVGHLRQNKNIREVDNEECNEEYYNLNARRLPEGIKEELMICTKEADTDACKISSGAPLQIFNRDVYCMYDIVGILSFGKGYCSSNSAVYTRISPYIEWIESIVWPRNK